MFTEDGYAGRRVFDLAGSIAGLVLLTPLLAMLAVLIKIDSKGPVFYNGVRLGRYGRPFHMWKFRTMVPDAEKKGLQATPDGDPRVTTIGKWLRRYKLDELPQLINVLLGEMSLVGPRPEVAFYFEYYTEAERRAILSVRPGMTDYGSLQFHDEGKLLAGSSDPVRTYLEQIRDEKVKAQLKYIREQSLLVDVNLIFSTFWTVLASRLLDDDGLLLSSWRK
jgi:lipopolysaccharide/colanic/teichoic acid biosynthesis glycosyltransferase